MNEPPQKAVFYGRVSDTKQKTEGHGLESQEARCREYANRCGYEMVKVFKDDASGGVSDRPQFLEMLAFLKAQRGEPFIVIVDDINRISRSLEVHLLFRQRLKELGARFESPTQKFGDGADDRMVEMMLVNVAEYQRNKNAEQTQNRMRGRMLNGYWVFQAPRGYRYEKVGAHGKLLVRDEPLATIMQTALEGYASGRFQTLSEVKRYLETEPDFPRDTQHGEVPIQRIKGWLTQVLYAGYIDRPEWGVSLREAQHDGLITLETYKRIQDRLAGRAVAAPKAAVRKDMRADMPLRGFVLCGDCERPLTGGRSKGRKAYYVYYECHNKACASYRKTIRKADIEGAFETLLGGLSPTRRLFRFVSIMLKDLWDRQSEQLADQRRALAKQLKDLDAQIEMLVDRTLETRSPTLIPRYEARIRDLETQKAVLVEKTTRNPEPRQGFEQTFRTAMAFLSNPLNLWNSNRLEDKRAVLKLTFADQLAYSRNSGFRTANFSLPFKLLGQMNSKNYEMVPLA
ncbi:MAG: recombinase family protein [Maricaulaceae bacterium]